MNKINKIVDSAKELFDLPPNQLAKELVISEKLSKKEEERLEQILKNSLVKKLKAKSTIVFLFWLLNSPDSCISRIRRNGLFRTSKIDFHFSVFEALLAKALDLDSNLLSENQKSYLQAKSNLITLSIAIEKLVQEIDTYLLENKETFFKTSLVFLDFLFMKDYYPSIDFSNFISTQCKEDLADAVSFLIYRYQKICQITPKSFVKMNEDCLMDPLFQNIVENASKIRRYMVFEILTDNFDFNFELIDEIMKLIPPSMDVFKSIQLGYIFTEQQQFNLVLANSDIFKKSESLYNIAEKVSNKFSTILFKRKDQPISRYVFEIPDLEKLWEIFKTDELFAEDYLILKSLSTELHANSDEILDFKFTPNLKVKDFIILNRIFNFIRWSFKGFLDKKIENELPLVLRSILPVFETKKLVDVLCSFVSEGAAKDFLNLLSWDSSSFLDIQYQPIFSHGNYTILPLNIIGASNLVRNTMMKRKVRIFPDNSNDPLLDKITKFVDEKRLPFYKAVKFDFDGKEGDIDGLLIMNDQVFVFEAKNSLGPASTSELRTSFDYIKKAAYQLDKIKDLFFIEGFRQYLSKKIKYDLSSIKKIVTCILTGNRLFYGLNYNSHPVVFVNELFNFLKNESIVIKNKQTKLYCEKLSFQEKLTDFIEKNPMHKIAHSTSIIKDLTYKVDSFTVSEPRCTIELVDYAQNLQEIFPINEIESE